MLRLLNKLTNRKTLIFLLFVLAATFAWLINRLSKEYPYQLSYKLCVYSSTYEMPTICAENPVKVSVKASGFHILRHRSDSQLTIDIKRVKLRLSATDTTKYNIPVSDIQSSLTEAVNNEGIKVEHIITKTLLFDTK